MILTKKIERQILFFHEMGEFLKAGILMPEALELLERKSNIPIFMKNEVSRVTEDISSGRPIGASLRKHASFLDFWQLAVIESAEESRNFHQVFIFILHILEKKKQQRKRITSASSQPLFYAFLFIFIYPIRELMMVFIHRKFFYLSAYLLEELKIVVLFVFMGFVFKILYLFVNKKKFKAWSDIQILKVPLFGVAMQSMTFYQFFYVFETCLSSGRDILKSWQVSSNVSENSEIRRALSKGEKVLASRGAIDTAFFITKLFPDKIVTLMQEGARSGTLRAQLEKCMNLYEDKCDYDQGKIERIIPKIFFGIVAILLLIVLIKVIKGYAAMRFLHLYY